MSRKAVLATIQDDEYRQLVEQARHNDRRVDQQASHLLKRALREDIAAAGNCDQPGGASARAD
jgi:hypothetical protein